MSLHPAESPKPQDISSCSLVPCPTHSHAEFIRILKEADFDEPAIAMIDAAYDLSKRAHSDARRSGGGRYFEHCREVALILIQEALVRDPDVIAAALLHDTVEDTNIFGSYQLYGVLGVREVARERITRFFNERVADYVLAVTKVHKTGDVDLDTYYTAHYFEALDFAALGAILIKMADRLHNLRSVEARSIKKQQEQFDETTNVLLPIFERSTQRFNEPHSQRLLPRVRHDNELLGKRLAAAV